MISLDWKDETMLENLNIFISGFLPHEKYDSAYFSSNLNALIKLIPLDEMEGAYYILISFIKKINQLATAYNNGKVIYTPMVKWDVIDRQLQSQLPNLISIPQVQAVQCLIDEGLEASLSLESSRFSAQKILYKRVKELYDTCMSLQVDSSTCINYYPALKESFLNNAAVQSLYTQQAILKSEVQIGKFFYHGPNDWLRYCQEYTTELRNRLEDSDQSNILIPTSIADSEQLLQDARRAYEKIIDWGIPPVDDGTPVLAHRLTYLCANPNVGKTTIALALAGKALSEGKRVAIMCGENTKEKTYTQILSAYARYKHEKYLLPKEIAFSDALVIDKQRLLRLCEAEITENKLLVLLDSLHYHTVYDELKAIYDTLPFELLFIDHTYALIGDRSGNKYEALETMSTQLVKFRKHFPVSVVVLSHLSTLTADALIKHKKEYGNPTKGNGSLTSDADEIYILVSNDVLAKEHLLAMINTKRRDAPVLLEPIILDVEFDVKHFSYDPSLQVYGEVVAGEASQILEKVADEFKNSELISGSDADEFEDDEYIEGDVMSSFEND